MSRFAKEPFWPLLLIFLPLMLTVGCQNQVNSLRTEYGKIMGLEGGQSLNGTGVFSEMFVARGFKIKRSTRISPRIENYQTLVWFPDDHSCPSQKAVDAVNDWLGSGYDRTFIYVGRGYTAQLDYLNEVMQKAPLDQKEEILRLICEAQLSDADVSQVWWKEDLGTCDWFDRIDEPFEKTDDLTGPLAQGISPDAEIGQSTMLVPAKSSPRQEWEFKPLLTANGRDFVFQLKDEFDDYSDAKVVVVTNGSFLLNYSLIDRDNRILAGNLIDLCDPGGDVMFLESGPNGIKVSDTDTNNHNNWAWIAQAPLRYIVPHFLMWGILFCFVYFPIFGRPRKAKTQSTSTFRNHVNALGKMIGRSDLPNRAVNKIRKYQQLVGGESKRKKD